jgi:transposase
MGQPTYSIDLRNRVIAEVEEDASRHEAAERFKVSVSSAIRWSRPFNQTGSGQPRVRGGRPRSPLAPHAPWLFDLIAAAPDLTLEEIVARIGKELGATTSRSAVGRFYRHHGVSFKKNGACLRTRARQRLISAIPHGHWKTTTFVAGLRHDGIGAPCVIDGSMDGETFPAYVDNSWRPRSRPTRSLSLQFF